jgi:amidohydrolase
VEPKLIAWRRDIHQHPELGDQETRTAGLVAEHLKSVGVEVRTGVARTGVVGILKGGKPGRTVALRADMDFQSKSWLIFLSLRKRSSRISERRST